MQFVCALLIALVLTPHVLAKPPSTMPACESTNIPFAVRNFEAANYDACQDEIQQLKTDSSYVPECSILFYAHITRADDPQVMGWLIGYRLGRAGNGSVPMNRLALVDEFGRANPHPLEFPEQCAGDDGIAFEISPGKIAFAIALTEGRHIPGTVSVFSLEQKPRELFKCSTSLDYDKPIFESELYFLDCDGDKNTDILIDRTVRDFKRKQKWKEFEFVRYDPKLQRYTEARDLKKAEFRKLLDAGGGEDHVPRLAQCCPPYETSLEEQLEDIPKPRTSERPRAR